jgi:CHASE3 domain sensor protein
VSAINQNRTLAQQLSGAFVVFGALVGVAFLLTALAYGIGWAWLTPALERSRQAERAEGASHAAMVDEENGLRGYLLTRDTRFLEPYVRGGSKLRQANDFLASGAVSDAELTLAMVSMRLAEQRWSEDWAKAAADPQPGAASPSMVMGKRLFDAYRREQAAFADAHRTTSGSGTPTPRALVEAADAAMYESKHAGRNRVALSPRSPLPSGAPAAEPCSA